MLSIQRDKLIHLFVIMSILCISNRGWAWNGDVRGGLSISRTMSVSPMEGIQIMGSGRVSYEDGLSLIGTLSVPGRQGLSMLSIRVDAQYFNRSISLPGEGRLVTYQERSADGNLTLSASAYQGWIEVTVTEDSAEVHFELSVRNGDQVRTLMSQGKEGLFLKSLERSLDEGDDALATSGDLFIGVAEDGAEQGCDDTENYDDEDLYQTEEYTGCDEEADDWSDESTLGEDSYDSYDDSYTEDDSSSSCEEDDWAAQASIFHHARVKKTRIPKLIKLILRLFPFWCTLLMISLWRRRILRQYSRTPTP